MNFLNQEIDDFKVQAYQDGDTKEVTKADVLVSGASSSSTRPTSPLFVPTEPEALQDKYEEFKQADAEFTGFEDTEFVHKAWAESFRGNR